MTIAHTVKKLLPHEFHRLSRKEKIVTIALGATAIGGVLFLMDRFGRSTPRAYVNRYTVRGTWTDMAQKLGITIGANLDIKTAQHYLNQLNNAGLNENGSLDAATANALRDFQAHNGIEQSGVIDAETGNALQYFAAATSGSSMLQQAVTLPSTPAPTPWADAVAKDQRLGAPFSESLPMSAKGAQRALNDLLHLGMPLTGVIDATMTNAVKTFQAQNALPITGLIDAETANALLYLATAAATAHVTYKRQPQLAAGRRAAPPPLTPALQAKITASPGSVIDIGQGWVALGNCACRKDDLACLASCGSTHASGYYAGEGDPGSAHGVEAWHASHPIPMPLPPPVPPTFQGGPTIIGLQSTTMFDSKNYYGDPKPYWPASNIDIQEF